MCNLIFFGKGGVQGCRPLARRSIFRSCNPRRKAVSKSPRQVGRVTEGRTSRQYQRRAASRRLLTHPSRRCPPWYIFNVRQEMKALLKLCLILAACLSAVTTVRSAERQLRVNLETVRYAESKPPQFEWVFLMQGVLYRSTDELKRGLARLPKRSEVIWSPRCCIIGGEPLRTKNEIEELQRYCENVGVNFRHVPSG